MNFSGSVLESRDENLEIVFFSDERFNFRGFHARWSITGTKTNFTGLLFMECSQAVASKRRL